tara:strand:+ start:1412 stop:1795 length:384 start_codon:yes stop_codon:yes gene_type:complete
MPVINISILMDDALPVDKMISSGGEGNNCPLPTQDEELNAENQQIAIEEANYRESSLRDALLTDEVCGSCSAYNQTDEILKCIGDDSGGTGYCQIWKFVCKSGNVCDNWAEGGPITSDKQTTYKDLI